MSAELSKEEKRLLPYMKNDLYQKYYSIIVRHFPITSVVGHRLVDFGLLTISEHKEICNLPRTSAGPSLLCSLETKGDDSMALFYQVLVGAREERDVAVILQHVEEDAKCRKLSRDSGTSDLDVDSRSSSVHSLSGESIPLTRSANAELKVAIKHITEVSEEIHKNGKEIRKLLELQSKMERQLNCIMQTLSSAQWQGGSELGRFKSEHEMCCHSPKLSISFQGESSDPIAPVAATMRRHSMPATLDCVPEEGMGLIRQLAAELTHGEGAGSTDNPVESVGGPEEDFDEPLPQITRRNTTQNS